jgi:hypothetical protein
MREGNAGDAEKAHVEIVRARGHEHVSAEHRSTFEVTTDDYLTPAGDCILGVEADRAPADFDESFADACRDPDAKITATLLVGDPADGTGDAVLDRGREAYEHEGVVVGRGSPELTLESDRSLVCRTSEYVDDRTVMLEADHGAVGFDRELVAALEAGAPAMVILSVEP